MTSDVVEALKEARALVAKGWCQNKIRDGKSYCAAGAIDAATDSLQIPAERIYQLRIAARDVLRKEAGTRLLSLWNDERGRTQAEVVALFDRAIAMESNHE